MCSFQSHTNKKSHIQSIRLSEMGGFFRSVIMHRHIFYILWCTLSHFISYSIPTVYPQSEGGKNKIEQTNSSSSRYTSAQIRLVLIFCTHGLATLIIYSAYSVVLRHEQPYSQALEEYFDCESFGNHTHQMCSRETFEKLDPTSVTFPLVISSYAFLPVSTLVYVANVDKLSNVIRKAKFQFLTKCLW